MWDKVKSLVGGVAPTVGGMLAGNLGESAGKMIASVLGVDPTPEAVEQELRNNPDALLKLKAVEADLEKARIQARSDVVQAETKSESWLPRNWRPLTMLAFVGMIAGYWFGLTPELPETAIADMFGLVKLGLGGYVFGRSAEKITKEVSGSGMLDKLKRK